MDPALPLLTVTTGLTALAAWLACAAPSGLGGLPSAPSAPSAPTSDAGAGRAPARVRVPALVTGAVTVAVLAGGSGRSLVLAAVVAATVLGAGRLSRARRSRVRAEQTAARVGETSAQLAADLAAGSSPGLALTRAAAEWGVLAPAAEAFRVGSDVPAALRAVSTRPGAADLRLVAAAWQVAHRTGDGLAGALGRVAEGMRAARSTRRVVQGELASARATARLVAALPVLALLMGTGAGGDPWGFLLGTTPGLACLAGGLGFGLVGLSWIEAIARDVEADR